MFSQEIAEDKSKGRCAVHLLDVGVKEYGDAVLCEFGEISVLIDGAHTGDQVEKGGHPSIPDQLGELLNQAATPYRVSLLIITHAHEDHIGCLPYLVGNDLLRADWALVADPKLGWGRGVDEQPDSLPADERVRQLTASLREEIRTKGTDKENLLEFLSDAANLEQRYNDMLQSLKDRGTRIVCHGRDNPSKLLKAFESIGLKIIGPSRDQLAICAERIARSTQDSLQDALNLFQADDNADLEEAYRRLVSTSQDSADASSRPGPAINLQSLVISFNFNGHKLLFAGDMQFAKPQFKELEESVRALREKVQTDAPYSFVKLSHHGSDNAFNEEILTELGETKLFGICAGERSTAHPHRDILELLDDNRKTIRWVRTDHNGLSTILFSSGEPKITLSEGKINDAKPNTLDEMGGTKSTPPSLGEEVARPVAESKPKPELFTETQPPQLIETTPTVVEVLTKVPHVSTRVTITIDVEPQGTIHPAVAQHEPRPEPTDKQKSPGPLPSLNVAGGRQLSDLLFITSRQALAANIGFGECEHLLTALRERGMLLYPNLPADLSDSARAASLVRQQLSNHPKIRGVVLLGGYDVIPAQRLDCLPKSLRARLKTNSDADNFIVWSDDIYGDLDGDGMPEIPVSRIPDGKSAQLVFAAIEADNNERGNSRFGVRNVMRPFADHIFKALPGTQEIIVSEPAFSNQERRYMLDADRVYIMLHGDYTDSSRFWGEETPGNQEAVNFSNIPRQCGPVVFTGCCWGGLTVSTPAGRLKVGNPFASKTPEESIALKFLLNGATAFIGCTGAHYSPRESPYQYFGGPLHEAFWRFYEAKASPAETLFRAKLEYLKGMPHEQTTPTSQAIEYKIFRQYTCLGLGW